MDDLISRQKLLKKLPNENWGKEWDEALAKAIIESMPTIDAAQVVRCKDCQYRPIENRAVKHGNGLEFPIEYKCPGECDDPWYSWMPDDNWFCANGKRKTNEG